MFYGGHIVMGETALLTHGYMGTFFYDGGSFTSSWWFAVVDGNMVVAADYKCIMRIRSLWQ